MGDNKIKNYGLALLFSKILLATVTFTLLVGLVYSSYSPMWETNDDVAMSMVAHGYGLSAIATPNIIFSNVLWGRLVSVVPTINGVLGYSLATISVLILSGATFVFFLLRAQVGVVCVLGVIVLLMLRPLLFPQFTVNSGLLSIAAVMCWYSFGNDKNSFACAAAVLFSSLAYLIRSQEFLLVVVVALPLLPLRKMYNDKICRGSIFLLFVMLVSFSLIDRQAYQSDEWKSFNDFNIVRAKFTDFGAGAAFKNRSDILEQHSYSINDVDLLSSWFFADPSIANTHVLQSMISQLGFIPDEPIAVRNIWAGIQALWDPKLVFLTLAALVLAKAYPRVLLSWFIFLLAICVISLAGRPAILRVYVPVLCLLVLSPLLLGRFSRLQKIVFGTLLLGAAGANSYYVFVESQYSTSASKSYLIELADFPTGTVVVWGTGLPYESLYPVLGGADLVSMKFKIYALGVFTLAPFALSAEEERLNGGLVKQIVTRDGVKIVGPKISLLKKYCREHFDTKLVELGRESHGPVEVVQIRCGG